MKRKFSVDDIKSLRQYRSIYISSILSYALVLLLPLLVSFFMYQISSNEAKQYAIDINNQTLSAASESLDQHIRELTDLSHTITINPIVRSYQHRTEGFSYPYSYRLNEVRDSLIGYSQIQSFISSYLLFFNNSQIAINDAVIYRYEDLFEDFLIFPEQEHSRFVNAIQQQHLSIGLQPAQSMSLGGQQGEYLSFVQPLYGNGNGYLISFIDSEKIIKLFDSISLGNTGVIYIARSDGHCLISRQASKSDYDYLYTNTIQDSIEQPDETHYTLFTSSNEAMLVNQLTRNGLTYVSIQPMSIILERVRSVRNMMLIFMFCAVIVGLFLCLRQALRITTPLSSIMQAVGLHSDDSLSALKAVEDIVHTMKADNAQLLSLTAEHRSLLRASYVSRLLNGSFSSEEEAFRLCQYVLPGYERYRSAIVLLFHLQPLEDMSNPDTPLKLMSSMKVALKERMDRELGQPPYYDIDEETLAVIVFNQSKEQVNHLQRQLFLDYPSYMQKSIRAYAGEVVTGALLSITRSYETAHTTLLIHSNDIATDDFQLIWPDEEHHSIQYFFPSDVGYQLTDALMQGNVSLVKRTLNELFSYNFVQLRISSSAGKLLMAELLGTAVRCEPTMRGAREATEELLNQCLNSIGYSPDRNQQALFLKYFSALASCSDRKLIQQDAQKKSRFISYLKQHFHQNDLSLVSIAEHFSLSPSAFSTEFKQYTGKNVSSYIEELRIQEAKRLLRTTNKTINQIASEVGYLSANSFCRAYRRNTGENASAYRSLTKEN